MMRSGFRSTLLATAFGLLFSAPVLPAAPATAVSIDKPRLEAFIRYTEGYTAMVKMTIDDPAPSTFKGFSRVAVHLVLGPQTIDKIYFVTADGQQVVNGTLWDMKASPFLDTLTHMPHDGPSFGPADAKVTMVVFSDFQCPYCREFAKTLREKLPVKFGKDVRVAFENFPIASIHKWADAGAEAGACVSTQNSAAFWPFHDWIFEHQGELNPANIKDKVLEYSKTHTLDVARLGTCLDTHASAAIVKKDIAAGQALGVQQTPTLFINGRMISGALPWDSLQAVIQLELSRPAEVPGPIAVKP